MSFPPQDLKDVKPTESQSQDYQASRLLASLGDEGCPICRETSGSDERFFFWFFHENYGAHETLGALTRSLGFCPAHGARAVLNPAGQSSLAVVHEVLARRIGSILSREGTGRARRKRRILRFSGFFPGQEG